MSILKKSYGFMPDGREVFLYTLDNEKNVKAEILTYGGIIRSLLVKDKKGNYQDVVLGRDSLSEYLNNNGYFGALIGRHANRIGQSKFSLNGKEYRLTANNGANNLHGGNVGFDKYVWDSEVCGDALILSIKSPNMDEGFPGNLDVKVTYEINDCDGLRIHYEAISDKDTIVNLTNHSYFNPNGIGNGNIYDLDVKMNCSFFTPNTDECIPNGEILSVKGTPFDFREYKEIGKDIKSNFEQIKMFGGYDHNFIIDGTGFREAASVYSKKTGIEIQVLTDKPGVQLYTGNAIEENRVCKDKKIYAKHEALCFETQYFPNSTMFNHFPSPILRANEKYDFTTEYRFIIK